MLALSYVKRESGQVWERYWLDVTNKKVLLLVFTHY
jgi:hypothetical protein